MPFLQKYSLRTTKELISLKFEFMIEFSKFCEVETFMFKSMYFIERSLKGSFS